jgi:hypothetical protein
MSNHENEVINTFVERRAIELLGEYALETFGEDFGNTECGDWCTHQICMGWVDEKIEELSAL